MICTIICSLSDVLIPGLKRIEKPPPGVARAAGDVILERLVAEDLHGLYVGEMTEEEFCHRLLDRAGWPTDIEHLRAAIRTLLRDEVPGTADVLRRLAGQYRLVLMADQAREWIDDLRRNHPSVLKLFEQTFFSYDLKTKADPGTFRMVLGLLAEQPAECLLIDHEQANLAAAAEAGIIGIRFKNADQLTAALADLHVHLGPRA